MASGSESYAGVNRGRQARASKSRAARAGKGKPSPAKQRQAAIVQNTIAKNGGNIF